MREPSSAGDASLEPPLETFGLAHRLAAEALGTALLLAIVVGSGIMGEQLAQGNAAIALLANSLATGAGLLVLIQCLGPVSGAHLNPVVSLVERSVVVRDVRIFSFAEKQPTIGCPTPVAREYFAEAAWRAGWKRQ